eukprot:6373605-Amphidinium_carterae.2
MDHRADGCVRRTVRQKSHARHRAHSYRLHEELRQTAPAQPNDVPLLDATGKYIIGDDESKVSVQARRWHKTHKAMVLNPSQKRPSTAWQRDLTEEGSQIQDQGSPKTTATSCGPVTGLMLESTTCDVLLPCVKTSMIHLPVALHGVEH